MIFAVIGLGWGACSNALLRDQTITNNGDASQNSGMNTQGDAITRESDLSLFFDLAYFNFDRAELSEKTRKVLGRQ